MRQKRSFGTHSGQTKTPPESIALSGAFRTTFMPHSRRRTERSLIPSVLPIAVGAAILRTVLCSNFRTRLPSRREDMSPERCFEIFPKFSNRQRVWVEGAASLNDAKLRIRELEQMFPGDYLIFDAERMSFIIPIRTG